MARTYENFDVELIASGPTYEARFRSIAGEPRLTIPFPLEQHELDAFLSLFGKYQTRRLESPEFAQVRAVGQRLFDSLFTEQVRDALRVATRAAMQEGHGLRVRLDVSQARDLGMVPWEYMYFREYDDFVSLSNWTPVVRHLDVAEPLPPVHLDGPLRILVMISDPIERRGTLDVEREWSQLQQALEGPVSRGEIELYRLPDGQLETLQVDLQKNSYHVFHFIGHGEYSEEHEDGVLVLEDSRGREVHVPGNTLGTYLRDSLDTRLVVLNNCEGAAFESDPFTGSAQSLLRKGIPAIVAMQFEITDRAAIDFARGFYTSVGNGFPVDAALAEARKVIRGGPTLIEFGSPVLYMSADDGILFIRAEEVEIPDDSKHTSLTPAGVKRVEEDLPAAEDVEPGGDLKETRGATVETAPGRLVELKDGGTDDTKGEEAAAATVEIAPDTETQPIGPEDEKAEPPDKRVWAIGGMAVAGILGLVIVINVLTDNDPPIETTQTTAVVTTVTVADTTVPAEASPFLPWTRVAEQDSLGGDGGQIMHDVLKVDDGWVAVGSETTSEGKHAAAWTSEDGLEWDRIGPEGFPTETSDGPEMRSVVQLSDQLVAAGVTSGDDTDAVVWTSVDGTEWRRVSSGSFGGEGNQAIRSLTVWEFGVVAVGWDNRGDSEGAVWTSADGIDWVRASDPDGALGGDGDQLMHDVAPGGPGLVAVGETQHPERDAEIWVSSDGDVWDRVDNTQAGLAEEGHQLANVIRAGPDILVVAGYDSGGGTGTDAAVWTSPDGETWQQVGDREELGGVNDQQIHGLTRVGNGWVAAGWTHPNPNDKDPAIWASEDADSWLRITDPDALARSGTQQVEAVAAAGSTIVAVGIDGEVETRDVAVWIGQPD